MQNVVLVFKYFFYIFYIVLALVLMIRYLAFILGFFRNFILVLRLMMIRDLSLYFI